MTRFAILSSGALGLAVIGRAAAFYAGVDQVALVVCLAMAVVMIAGLVELDRATRTTEALRNELSDFAKHASIDALEKTSPVLRALLRARLERVALPVPSPVFTPYFVGLLVMLGLLGTFLGLFETLRGARVALAASADVDALRAGLERPMAGLMRSFGASAAGVSGSALLGLASVFSRRIANLLTLELHACVSGPLASESPVARQLDALVALARQGEALPIAARALEAAATDVRGLASTWTEAHRTATKETLSALEGAMARVHGTLEKSAATTAASLERSATESRAGLEASAKAAHAALEASSKASAAALTENANASRVALESAAVSIRESIERGVVESAEASRKAVEPILARGLEETVGSSTKHLASVTALFESQLASLAARLTDGETTRVAAVTTAFASAANELTARLEDRSGAQQRTADERAARLEADATERATKLTHDVEGLVAKWGELTSAYETHGKASADREVERAARLADTASRIENELGAAATAMHALVAKSAEASRAEQERAETLFTRLSSASTEVAQAASTQAAALESLVSSAAVRAADAEAKSDARLTSFLAKVDEAISVQAERLAKTVESQATRAAEIEELVRTSHERSALALAEQLASQAKGIGDGLAETTTVVREAAGLVHAGGAELSAVAEAFAGAVDRQQRAAEEWLANLGRVEAAVAEAGETAAADALGQHLAHTHELFDRQLRFQGEVYEQLRALRRAVESEPAVIAAPEAAPTVEEAFDGPR